MTGAALTDRLPEDSGIGNLAPTVAGRTLATCHQLPDQDRG